MSKPALAAPTPPHAPDRNPGALALRPLLPRGPGIRAPDTRVWAPALQFEDSAAWTLRPLLLWDSGVLDPSPRPQGPRVQPPSAPLLARGWGAGGVRAPPRPTANPGPPARTLLPKLIPSGAGREWLERRRATIRPWGSFVDQRRFSRPRNLGELCQRLVRNVEYYQSNYVFVFLGLILYCV